MKYTYICNNKKCKYEFEKEHSMKESPKFKCLKCSGCTTRKIFAPALRFRGPGFYITDNRPEKIHPEAHQAHKEGKI